MYVMHMSGDPEVDAFVGVNLVSFPAWDLLLFLNANPTRALSLQDLASALGRSEKDLEPALRRCIASGVVVAAAERDGVVVYRLTDEPAFRDLLARFVAVSSDREVRLELVRHVMSRLLT